MQIIKKAGKLCQSKQNAYLCTRYYELVALIQIIHLKTFI